MGLTDRIAEIEAEIARTQKNKATNAHIGRLKAQIAKCRADLALENSKSGPKGAGFEVGRQGHSRICLIGFPSVGKSTLLNEVTGVESEAAEYEFTTLTCVPGIYYHNGAKIQLLDLPGIIEGAASGRGRGRQVIAVAKSCDMVLVVLDATKDDSQKEKIEKELHAVGIRLNCHKPRIQIIQRKMGGVTFSSGAQQSVLTPKIVETILKEYKIHNADVSAMDDCSLDDLVDTIMGNCVYLKCLYAYNKIDLLSLAEIDEIARKPDSIVICSAKGWNTRLLKDRIWDKLEMVRVYTKKKGEFPDLQEPIILTTARGGSSVERCITQLHRSLLDDCKTALVWGQSVKHQPQQVSLKHTLADEDVVQIIKTAAASKLNP